MASRPCLGSSLHPMGHTFVVGGSRCPDCRRDSDRRELQRKRAKRPRVSAEDRRRAATVAAWRAEYGDWCPGWQRAAHPSSDLTADHVVAVAVGGDEHGELTVLCRSCNGRKQAGLIGHKPQGYGGTLWT